MARKKISNRRFATISASSYHLWFGGLLDRHWDQLRLRARPGTQVERWHDEQVEQRRGHQPAEDDEGDRIDDLGTGTGPEDREREQRGSGRHRGPERGRQAFPRP